MSGVKPIKTDSIWSYIPWVSQVALDSIRVLNVQVDGDKTAHGHACFGILI
ncbi:hypothetical protein [Pseudomonas aeruginosa]|uniref:hypothetical protein n=1 Tax=Pseudomonas aeruginosa TaxID=287 RepID=UPI00147DAC2F|nr:hypothetical protein [Pseudomonas aeruginosa]